jgi:hypothetical protein
MDPYLERHWRDVHTKLIAYASDQLNQGLPEDLIARAEERMAVEVESGDGTHRRSMAPDVRVFEVIEDLSMTATAGGGGLALAPFRLTVLTEPLIERFIEIVDIRGGERLVTVIEFISPTNKGDGIKAFIDKRNELLGGGVNVVEVDLVREGNWRRLLGHPCPAKAESVFRAVLRLPGNLADVYLHPFPLREPLPSIKIPLRANEPPCNLSLQPLLDQAYRNGRYSRTIDYRRASEPPLDGDDAAWADELLRSAGRR